MSCRMLVSEAVKASEAAAEAGLLSLNCCDTRSRQILPLGGLNPIMIDRGGFVTWGRLKALDGLRVRNQREAGRPEIIVTVVRHEGNPVRQGGGGDPAVGAFDSAASSLGSG